MRIIKLLVYEGEVEWIKQTLARSINGRKDVGSDRSITSILLGTFPDDLEMYIRDNIKEK